MLLTLPFAGSALNSTTPINPSSSLPALRTVAEALLSYGYPIVRSVAEPKQDPRQILTELQTHGLGKNLEYRGAERIGNVWFAAGFGGVLRMSAARCQWAVIG